MHSFPSVWFLVCVCSWAAYSLLWLVHWCIYKCKCTVDKLALVDSYTASALTQICQQRKHLKQPTVSHTAISLFSLWIMLTIIVLMLIFMKVLSYGMIRIMMIMMMTWVSYSISQLGKHLKAPSCQNILSEAQLLNSFLPQYVFLLQNNKRYFKHLIIWKDVLRDLGFSFSLKILRIISATN